MAASRISSRATTMAPFEVMDMVRAASARDEVVRSAIEHGDSPLSTCHLEVGQPSHPTPAVVLDAAREALDGPLGYTEALGDQGLRHAVSGHYLHTHGLELDRSRIAITSGASAGVVLVLLAVADVGETIVVVGPGYPCYRNIAEALGIHVISITVDASTAYRLTPRHLDEVRAGGERISAVLVATPSNPTGTVLDVAHLDALHEWCSAAGSTLVVDEIYHGTATETLATSAAYGDAVVVQSFSKYFCMTGWRLGWLVLPEELVRPVERLAQNLYLSPHALSQRAALAAFGATDELTAHAHHYARNRKVLIRDLRSAGVTDIAPAEGAFYVWADMSGWGHSRELCRAWLTEIGVAATPGTDFDRARGADFVRFSVAGSAEEVATAADRLGAWLAARPPEPSGTEGTG